MNLHSKPQRAVALVIILGMLVIVLGLAITFLSRTSVERSASSSFAASISTRQLADTAVNLVQGSIRDASTRGVDVAWASQPGMVRTFDTTGNMLRAYKLYSSRDMIAVSANFTTSLANDIAPASWASDTATWTDLNAPVRVNGVANYPILDPTAAGTVEGFTISAPAGGNSTAGQMPIRWLYVLQNGDLVAGNGTGATVTVTGATAANPIVGRIAFWTDDETAKININTASEGTFWDSPRTTTNQDLSFANNQPASREFQRYPGHPAMTSLAPVFFASNATATGVLSTNQREAIYQITPRVVGGGSNAGTQAPLGPITPDSDRLFASVDEMIFAASRGGQPAVAGLTRDRLERARFFLTANSRAPETTLFNTPRVSIWPLDVNSAFRTPLDRLMAFCTTINRPANGGQGYLFSFQRSNPQSATADYDLIARNKLLYRYLRNLTARPVPGFGGNFANKYGLPNRNQLITQIFDYIRCSNLDDSTNSDFAHRFSTRGRVLGIGTDGTSISTPLNSGFGQVTPIRIEDPPGVVTQGFGRFPVVTELGIHFICTADAGPSGGNGTLGSNVLENTSLGGTLLLPNQRRIEARFVFDAFVPAHGFPPYRQAFTIRVRGLDAFSVTDAVSAAQSLNLPSDGVFAIPQFNGNLWHGRAWGGVLSVRNVLASTRSPARGPMLADPLDTEPARDPLGGLYNVYPFISPPITITANDTQTMAFSGGGRRITVDVYPGLFTNVASLPANPVQTISVTFKDILELPVPILVGNGTPAPIRAPITPATVPQNWWSFSRGPTGLAAGGRSTDPWYTPSGDQTNFEDPVAASAPFRSEDVVRTMVPRNSDFRLLFQPNNTVPFEPHPFYPSETVRLAHSFTEASGSLFRGGETSPAGGYVAFAADRLAAGASYNIDSPDVAIYDARAANGDWDTGISRAPDGPYINKADEGNSRMPSPYFDNDNFAVLGPTLFSANRQLPSAGMFGSLPTGLATGEAYRTLLVRPQSGHFGWELANGPRDHLLLDLFWMPVVEPYAISEPFSTAGKINMNYEIMPFRSMIRRATGMAAVLRGEMQTAFPVTFANRYKRDQGTSVNTVTRFPINIPNTLLQFDDKFARDDVFRSATQICEAHMIPVGESVAATPGSGGFETAFNTWATNYWNANRLTGDNVRERIYTNLLGRLTTKSNSYTVHMRVQALRKVPGTPANVWDDVRDKVVGEYRGSTTVERYISPNDTSIPDYASLAEPWPLGTLGLGSYYKWRTVSSRQFAP